MKLVNRGFLLVKPKQEFLTWANQFDEEMDFSETDDCEGNVYLIEEDFFDIEPLIEQNFKKIFKNELSSVTDEENWPEKLTIELFATWFEIDFGSTVFDMEKSDLKTEKI